QAKKYAQPHGPVAAKFCEVLSGFCKHFSPVFSICTGILDQFLGFVYIEFLIGQKSWGGGRRRDSDPFRVGTWASLLWRRAPC
ncbi:MAG: hypothetical protein KDE04_08080, partial [Anaerolineales bacterium]|nr:hypothetical protein [Anaerolineales bacterium]